VRGHDRPLRILVSGMIAGIPNQGGAAWAVLQYLLGFHKLGHEVIFVEQCEQSSIRPDAAPLAQSANASYFHEVMANLRLEEASALLREGSQETIGVPYSRLHELAAGADVLVNISGLLTDRQLTEEIPIRIYVDLDPAFTQLWHSEGIDMRFDRHTHFATVGQAIGVPGCPIPNCGLSWIPIFPPVALDYWPPASRVTYDAFTSVGNWRGYGSVEYEGVHYGQRVHSMRQFISLPTLTDARFLLALAIHEEEEKDLEALTEAGWELLDPARVAGTPAQYRQFVQGSSAEFGVAKSGYVVSHSGWFSDRSACYLASGRPVIAQETGFSRYLPVGEGLFAFRTVDDALAGVEELKRAYADHARAARSLVEEYLDSDKVLTKLLREVGASR
jgi:hypothetical protein